MRDVNEIFIVSSKFQLNFFSVPVFIKVIPSVYTLNWFVDINGHGNYNWIFFYISVFVNKLDVCCVINDFFWLLTGLFFRFPTNQMSGFIELAKEKGMAETLSTVCATGGGAYKFEQVPANTHSIWLLIGAEVREYLSSDCVAELEQLFSFFAEKIRAPEVGAPIKKGGRGASYVAAMRLHLWPLFYFFVSLILDPVIDVSSCGPKCNPTVRTQVPLLVLMLADPSLVRSFCRI